MKRTTSILLVIIMVFSMGIFAHAEKSGAGGSGSSKIVIDSSTEDSTEIFLDVPTDHWAFDEIQFFYRAGIVAGISESTFAPNENVTREQFAKLLAVAFAKTDYIATDQTFSDVTSDMWSYNYIEAVKSYLTGYYPKGEKPFFNPFGKASREDIAYSLVKIIGLDEKGQKNDKVLEQFSDSGDISPSIKDFVGIAMENGLIRGYEDNTFRPNQGITRAETVVLLFRALKAPVDNTPSTSTEPNVDDQTPESTPDPTPEPSIIPKSDYEYSLTSDNIERISGYSGQDVKGNVLLEWSPTVEKATFTADMKLRHSGMLDFMGCKITLVELTSCTTDKVNGYFKVVVDNNIKDAKIKGTIIISDKKLILTTKEYDYNLIANDCKLIKTKQPDEEVKPNQPDKEKNSDDEKIVDEEENDDEEIWYDCKSVYSGKLGVFKGNDVNGEISGFASVDFSIYEKVVRFRAEVDAKTKTDGNKKFKIILIDTKSFSVSEIIGTFNIICNDEIVAENIQGRITNIDGELEEKMLFKTDDNVWSLEMIIVERVL